MNFRARQVKLGIVKRYQRVALCFPIASNFREVSFPFMLNPYDNTSSNIGNDWIWLVWHQWTLNTVFFHQSLWALYHSWVEWVEKAIIIIKKWHVSKVLGDHVSRAIRLIAACMSAVSVHTFESRLQAPSLLFGPAEVSFQTVPNAVLLPPRSLQLSLQLAHLLPMHIPLLSQLVPQLPRLATTLLPLLQMQQNWKCTFSVSWKNLESEMFS